MNRTSEMEAFLREGLKRYPEARHTVETFEEEIKERLTSLLTGKTDWLNFKPRPDDQPRAVSAKTGNGMDGCWIWASRLAHDNDDTLSLGLWWGCPRADDLILYASYWKAGGRELDIKLESPTPPVVCKPADTSKRRLFVHLKEGDDLAEMARLLLDDMDRALPASLNKG